MTNHQYYIDEIKMVKWVEIQGLSPNIMTEATARVVRETIGPALQVDQAEIRRGVARPPGLGFTVQV